MEHWCSAVSRKIQWIFIKRVRIHFLWMGFRSLPIISRCSLLLRKVSLSWRKMGKAWIFMSLISIRNKVRCPWTRIWVVWSWFQEKVKSGILQVQMEYSVLPRMVIWWRPSWMVQTGLWVHQIQDCQALLPVRKMYSTDYIGVQAGRSWNGMPSTRRYLLYSLLCLVSMGWKRIRPLPRPFTSFRVLIRRWK